MRVGECCNRFFLLSLNIFATFPGCKSSRGGKKGRGLDELEGKKTAACTPTSVRSSRQVAPERAEDQLPSQLTKRKSSKERESGLDILATIAAAEADEKEDEKCEEDCYGAALKRQRSEPPVVADVFEAFAEERGLFCEDENAVHFLRLLWKRLMISNEWSRKCEEAAKAGQKSDEPAKESDTREAQHVIERSSETSIKGSIKGVAVGSFDGSINSSINGSSQQSQKKESLVAQIRGLPSSSSSKASSSRCRSVSLSEYPADDEYWISSKAARDIPYDWHARFFVQLSHLVSIRGVAIRESVLIEYLSFLSELDYFSDLCFLFRSIKDSFSPLMQRGASKAVKKLFNLLGGVIYHESGKDFLLQMQKHGRSMGVLLNRANFQEIVIDLVKRFGENVFDRRLRVRDFVEPKMFYSHDLFINFAPLLRLFSYQSVAEFEQEREEFTALFDFYAGDRSSVLSFGPGGLYAINDLVKRSNVLITAFDDRDLAVRNFCVNWMFKNMFALLDYANLIVLLRNYNMLPLMELAFAFNTNHSQWQLKTFLHHLLTKNERFYEDLIMTLFVIAYVPFDKDMWVQLKKDIRDSGADMKHVDIAFGLAEAASSIDFTRIAQGQPLSIKLTPKIENLGILSDLYKEPLELEFMQIVLARKLGLPIWATKFVDYSAEGVEWSEAVGFANEHLLHAAAVCDYSGPISVVSVERVKEGDYL